jgi:hypothetical protein
MSVLAAVLPAVSACSPRSQAYAGQCRPPFQLHVVFRAGTSKQAAAAAMRKCQANPMVIRIRQLQHPYPTTPGQWTAIIYTTRMPSGDQHITLLTCLHRSPAGMTAAWPD